MTQKNTLRPATQEDYRKHAQKELKNALSYASHELIIDVDTAVYGEDMAVYVTVTSEAVTSISSGNRPVMYNSHIETVRKMGYDFVCVSAGEEGITAFFSKDVLGGAL